MVLTRRRSKRTLDEKLVVKDLRSILVLVLVCASVVGCSGTQADQKVGKRECSSPELELDQTRMTYISESIQRLFQWSAYWTYNDEESKSLYNAKIGRKIPLDVYSLARGVIVYLPSLGTSVVMFEKSPDGNLSNPNFLVGGIVKEGLSKVEFEGDKLMAIAKAIGDWNEFLVITGKETQREIRQFPVILSDLDKQRYIANNRDTLKYCQIGSELNLLPLAPPTYDPMDERKQILLGELVRASQRLVQRMFAKGEMLTITLPNFNVNDERVWILIEDEKGEGCTMSMGIDTMNRDAPVNYESMVELRSNPKYGIKIGAEEKIKKAAAKVLSYKVL